MKYELGELTSQLAKLKVSYGDTIIIHSSLHSFGIPAGVSKAELCDKIFKQLQSMVGEEGNIVVPTFNFGFCRGQLYDINQTPSEGMGIFSEFVRELNDSIRSKHPIQSISVVGKHARSICSIDTHNAFEKKSSFAKLMELNATVLLIGAPIQSVSFVHIAEEQNLVPYRYHKDFRGKYRDYDGQITEKSYGMFVRNLDINPILKMKKIEKLLENKALIKKQIFNSGTIAQFKANQFLDIINDKLKINPNWLIED